MTEIETGHAIHFLERLSRANEAQRELALTLYWDPDRVRFVLSRAALPPGGGRVALSLNERDRGPWIVVEREGRFVTCLGEGMTHDLPVIEHARLLALLARADTQRERFELARELCGDRRLGSVFGLLKERGEGVCREEILAAAALQPALRVEIFAEALHQLVTVSDLRLHLERCKAVTGRDAPVLRDYWQRLWYASALYPLFAMGGLQGISADLVDVLARTRGALSWYLSRHDDRVFSLRAAFLAGKVGKPTLAAYKHNYRSAPLPSLWADALLSLVAIAVRHPRHRAEIVKTLKRFDQAPLLVKRFIATLPEGWTGWLLRVLFQPDGMYADIGAIYQRAYVEAAGRCPVPPEHRYERPEDVPLDLAYGLMANGSTASFSDPEGFVELLGFIPWLARIEGPELFLPRGVLGAFGCSYTQERALELLGRHKAFESTLFGPPRPVTRQGPEIGRNDPCPCGSGKKFKKCCGATAGGA